MQLHDEAFRTTWYGIICSLTLRGLCTKDGELPCAQVSVDINEFPQKIHANIEVYTENMA